jgi:hypothetical protein
MLKNYSVYRSDIVSYYPEKERFLSTVEGISLQRLHAIDASLGRFAKLMPETTPPLEPAHRPPQGILEPGLYQEQQHEAAIGVQQQAIEQSRRDAEEARNGS